MTTPVDIQQVLFAAQSTQSNEALINITDAQVGSEQRQMTGSSDHVAGANKDSSCNAIISNTGDLLQGDDFKVGSLQKYIFNYLTIRLYMSDILRIMV